MKYFFILLAIVVGTILVIKTEWFVENFGKNAWAEEHLGTEGGTRLMYKLIGIAMILVAFLVYTGGVQSILLSVFGRLFAGLN